MDPASRGAAPLSPDLVPELLVTDLATSLDFWVGFCGFRVLYDRPYEGFAALHQGSARLMLEEIGVGRNWVPGVLERPLGRGVNFQISVPALPALLERLASAGWPLFMAPEEKWYQTGDSQTGVTQFLVQDPDGYLVRFTSRLGARPA